MPDPQAHPQLPSITRVAKHTLYAGVAITLLKFAAFFLTNSAAVLSDAMESIINLIAAAFMLYSIWLSNRPADSDHPYGHGKVEFMTLGLEGWMIVAAGMVIIYESIRRLFQGADLKHLTLGAAMVGVISALSLALAGYVWWWGKRFDSPVLKADAKHLFTDAISTLGVLLGVLLIRYLGPGYNWLDPLIALGLAAIILYVSWQLLWESIHGLMDRTDPKADALIKAILDSEVAAGEIRGYHKVRHRHTGRFLWIDMHLQIPGDLTIREGHDLASRVEARLEQELAPADATAHVEPADSPAAAPPDGDEARRSPPASTLPADSSSAAAPSLAPPAAAASGDRPAPPV